MSEWAYRTCTCGNRIHINFTCDKCDADPWNVRKQLEDAIDKLEKEKHRIELRLADIKGDIRDLKDSLKKSHIKKKKE